MCFSATSRTAEHLRLPSLRGTIWLSLFLFSACLAYITLSPPSVDEEYVWPCDVENGYRWCLFSLFYFFHGSFFFFWLLWTLERVQNIRDERSGFLRPARFFTVVVQCFYLYVYRNHTLRHFFFRSTSFFLNVCVRCLFLVLFFFFLSLAEVWHSSNMKAAEHHHKESEERAFHTPSRLLSCAS